MGKYTRFLSVIVVCSIVSILALSSCNSSDDKTSRSSDSSTKIKLISYDSFPKKDTGLNTALKKFEKDSGIKVEIVNAGDTGTMVSKAILTAGNPEGDVIWGVDDASLSRALDADVFESYKSKDIKSVNSQFTKLTENNEVTPVDYGDVCINYDIAWFEQKNIAVPTTLEDLTKPEYKGLLAVEDPSSSSPGLAFLLATIDRFGENGFEKYWEQLRNNEVKVSESWDSAYYELFSGSTGKGAYPLVVSYATSPVAEVVYADPPIDKAPTASIEDSCYRQIEFAGILRGTKHKNEAEKLVDFLISEKFQKEIPLALFVFPSRENVELPEEFSKYYSKPESSTKIAPSEIEKNRETWVDKWTQTVLR